MYSSSRETGKRGSIPDETASQSKALARYCQDGRAREAAMARQLVELATTKSSAVVSSAAGTTLWLSFQCPSTPRCTRVAVVGKFRRAPGSADLDPSGQFKVHPPPPHAQARTTNGLRTAMPLCARYAGGWGAVPAGLWREAERRVGAGCETSSPRGLPRTFRVPSTAPNRGRARRGCKEPRRG